MVFFCSDPCAGGDPELSESNFSDLAFWVRETIQPLPELLRSQLPAQPPVGRPVIYRAELPVVTGADPPSARQYPST